MAGAAPVNASDSVTDWKSVSYFSGLGYKAWLLFILLQFFYFPLLVKTRGKNIVDSGFICTQNRTKLKIIQLYRHYFDF